VLPIPANNLLNIFHGDISLRIGKFNGKRMEWRTHIMGYFKFTDFPSHPLHPDKEPFYSTS